MIYFDNAATTLVKPECVISADTYALKNLSANSGRGSHAAAAKAASIVYSARKAVKDFLNCDEVVFGFNCTDALNLAVFGSAKRGHVVTTTYEHNSVLRPLYELQRRGTVSFTAVEPDEHGIVDPKAIERAIRKDTYMIIVNHVSNVTGAVAPVAQIGAIARKYGLLYLIDGAQSVGYIDIDMKELGCDYLCFSPHKGLHGTQGLGVLCMKSGAPIRPIRFGGTGSRSDTLEQPVDIPEGLECGTLPVHSIYALIAAIGYRKKLPVSAVRSLAASGEKLRSGLEAIRGVKLYGRYGIMPNIACFNIEGVPSGTVGDILGEQYDIAVRCGLHCAPLCHKTLGTIKSGAVRASLSYHNTDREVDFFLKAIKEIAER